MEESAGQCRIEQDREGHSRIVQDSAGQCRTWQDSTGYCRIVQVSEGQVGQGSARLSRQCKTIQDSAR